MNAGARRRYDGGLSWLRSTAQTPTLLQSGEHMKQFGLHGRGLFVCSQRSLDAEQAQPVQYFMKKVSAPSAGGSGASVFTCLAAAWHHASAFCAA